MSRHDTFTNTEHDAGRYDQATAYEVDDRDHATPSGAVEHECTSPNPATCLLCVLDDAVRAQKEAQRVLDEVNRERNAEWWA